MAETEIAVAVIGGIFCLLFVVLGIWNIGKRDALEKETRICSEQLENSSVESLVDQLRTEIASVEGKLNAGNAHYAQLVAALDTTNSSVDQIEVGLLPPVFKFDDSEKLKSRIRENRNVQYKAIKRGVATRAHTTWAWFGSEKVGRQMTDAYRTLLLKAYNAEFDFIRKQMRPSSLDTAITKLDRLSEQLARLGDTANVSIAQGYAKLKEDELKIWHAELVHKEEIKQKRKKQREILRQQNKQGVTDSDEIEDELADRKALLEKARKIALEMVSDSKVAIELEIQGVQKEIDDLNKKLERAQSQAQITKAGFIYVISNIGSFGEEIVKIGMTRRLEPLDRVRELGDASVPFKFDVHTLAFVENAPAIEKALHRKFNNQRVNKENNRKEFFKVPVDHVQAALSEMGVESDWYFEIEAKEYRESLLIRQSLQEQAASSAAASSVLPQSI